VGYWEGTLDYAKVGSHGTVQEVSMYSIMENPMTACGCFECIVMVIPEVKGVMVVSREDTGMTPMGMKFSTLAGIAGGGLQTPGVMGVGKFYIISPKFISADGGLKRITWMSKNLKDSMQMELRAAAERDGLPDFLDKIADGTTVTTVEELVAWVNEKDHPVLNMEPMEAKEREVEPEPAKDVIAQAEAVVEKAIAKEEAAQEPEPAAEAAPPPAEAVPPPVPTPLKPAVLPSAGSVEARVERLERAVTTLISSLVGALAEIGEVDVSQVATVTQAAVPAVTIPEPEAPARVELPPDKAWLADGTTTAIEKESWSGSVRIVQIGATAEEGGTRTSVVVVGGETAMPFMDFEGKMPNKPVIAIEIKDRRPDDWSELLTEKWGDVMDDPGEWAKAAEKAGADMILVRLSLNDADGNPTKPEAAVAAVKKVLEATGLPVAVFGPGQVDADNELLVPISDTFKGELLLLGICETRTTAPLPLQRWQMVT
jgi:hypothetical protein